jgi:hypothetical protein
VRGESGSSDRDVQWLVEKRAGPPPSHAADCTAGNAGGSIPLSLVCECGQGLVGPGRRQL